MHPRLTLFFCAVTLALPTFSQPDWKDLRRSQYERQRKQPARIPADPSAQANEAQWQWTLYKRRERERKQATVAFITRTYGLESTAFRDAFLP